MKLNETFEDDNGTYNKNATYVFCYFWSLDKHWNATLKMWPLGNWNEVKTLRRQEDKRINDNVSPISLDTKLGLAKWCWWQKDKIFRQVQDSLTTT